jgi:hypothetical protein
MVQLRCVHHDLHVLWRGAGTMHVEPAGHAFTMKTMQLAEEGRTLRARLQWRAARSCTGVLPQISARIRGGGGGGLRSKRRKGENALDAEGTNTNATKKPLVKTVPMSTRLSTAVRSISHAVANALVTAEKCLSTRLATRPPARARLKQSLG